MASAGAEYLGGCREVDSTAESNTLMREGRILLDCFSPDGLLSDGEIPVRAIHMSLNLMYRLHDSSHLCTSQQ